MELSPTEIIDYVHNYRNEYMAAQSCSSRRIRSGFDPRSRSRPKWTLPPSGWLKINCDAALDLQSGRAGVGIICRNEMGVVVECAALRKSVECSVATLEAMAIFDGLRIARRLGVARIMVESDSEIVIKSLILKAKDFSAHGQFVEASLKLADDFSNVSFCCLDRKSVV